MAKDSSFHDYILNDVFKDILGITSRSMFGGFGFYKNSVFFGLIADGALYFKVNEDNKKDYERRGSHPFVYDHKGKPMTMAYWSVPEDILEERRNFPLD